MGGLWQDPLPLLVVAGMAGISSWTTSEAHAFDLSRSSVPREEILSGGPPKDGIPAILEPRFVLTDEATFLRDEDFVIGLAVNGVAKAYPIKILNWHEVVNDTVGGQAVAVTWCPLTQSAIVFDRRVDNGIKTFGVSGRLYNSNVLMYDHQTESLWSQLREAAVTGPETGARLIPLASQRVTWRAWRKLHPDTTVLSTTTGRIRNYRQDPYLSYLQTQDVWFPLSRWDPRLQAKTKILGLVINNIAKAYPLESLKSLPQPLVDTIDGQTLHVYLVNEGDSAFATDPDGRLLHSTVLYWFAWAAFYPETLVYES